MTLALRNKVERLEALAAEREGAAALRRMLEDDSRRGFLFGLLATCVLKKDGTALTIDSLAAGSAAQAAQFSGRHIEHQRRLAAIAERVLLRVSQDPNQKGSR